MFRACLTQSSHDPYLGHHTAGPLIRCFGHLKQQYFIIFFLSFSLLFSSFSTFHLKDYWVECFLTSSWYHLQSFYCPYFPCWRPHSIIMFNQTTCIVCLWLFPSREERNCRLKLQTHFIHSCISQTHIKLGFHTYRPYPTTKVVL